MNEYNVVCSSCDMEFNVAFVEEDAEVRYCSFCGEELIEELDFNED